MPRPGSESISIRPPCAPMMRSAIVRPSPLPFGLPVVERLEHAREVLGGDPAAGIADRERDVAVLTSDLEREPAASVHRLDGVERDVPEHLGELVAVEREARDGRIDRHAHVHARGA